MSALLYLHYNIVTHQLLCILLVASSLRFLSSKFICFFLSQRKQKNSGLHISSTCIAPTSEFFTVALFLLMSGSQKLQILGGL